MFVVIVVVLAPRFPLLIALLGSGRPSDSPAALGPEPGGPPLIGLCTTAAEARGVRPGLRVGEALARCPELELVTPDPDGAESAGELVLQRLEAMGAAVEPLAPGIACFESRGLERLHGGLERVLRGARAALPVGADGRVGAASGWTAAIQAAREAPGRDPLIIDGGRDAEFLDPLPIERLARPLPDVDGDGGLSPEIATALAAVGVRTIGRLARMPRRAIAARFGPAGLRGWMVATGCDERSPRPRRPPEPLEAAMSFPDPVTDLPALKSAARLLLARLAGRAVARGRSLRGLTLRARVAGGRSWTHTLTLREAGTDRVALENAALPHLARIEAPVESLAIRGDASGPGAGHQLTIATHDLERRRRIREAVGQARAGGGEGTVLRAVEIAPLSRLPERRWALVPFDI